MADETAPITDHPTGYDLSPDKPCGITYRMIEAMKRIEAIEKKGHNSVQGYYFVRSADVANEVRKALIELHIGFNYDVLDTQHWERSTKSGGTMQLCQLTVQVTFTDMETGQTVSSRVIGWGSDTDDKAPYKAMTGALKYALRMNFMIPDEAADPEVEQEKKNDDSTLTEDDRTDIAKALRFYNVPKEDLAAWMLTTMQLDSTTKIKRSKLQSVILWIQNAPRRKNDEQIARQSMKAMKLTDEQISILIEQHKGDWESINRHLESVSNDGGKQQQQTEAEGGTEFFYADGDLQCLVLSSVRKEGTGNREYVEVKIDGAISGKSTAFCWHKSLFPALADSKGQICYMKVTPPKPGAKDGGHIVIDDVSKVGDRQYVKGKLYLPPAAGENGDAEPVVTAATSTDPVIDNPDAEPA